MNPISEIRARWEKATKGPWVALTEDEDNSVWCDRYEITKKPCIEDADFIAHSWQDISDLLQLVEKARVLFRDFGRCADFPGRLKWLEDVDGWLARAGGK